ncbi:MAG: hypothetical protein ACREMB_01450 [Candidatus Rokuibacteriota bacterium]
MRMARHATLGILALIGLLLACPAQAAAAAFVGSVTVEGAAEGEVVGFAVTANPGLEKTITQQLPPLTVPVIVEGDAGPGPAGPKFLKKNLDTLLVLTNTTGVALNLTLRLRDADGGDVGTQALTLNPFATQVIIVSNLLP